ncbi:DDE superfamily endonuclease [Nitzschia inconspicua]|uniref:DDE superfamily endonuclease n=1 Tax=Nitzschia inconspicua TaxID=303405 RepID=A0A9K3KAC9_9STRA|nr:DDE superfamily endonuclease [Nitzschia inconspicua]KAG7342336.1 DDE superfamily endonuclease [Nitzschia inconspicua]KAG7359722.1 DDE superfamily endonuclease [Nitzschia inconspicua]KAG7362607.1 DDE superfamily endonuclease [Nitzschia inconspicua]KAG7365630.1 DDE superfamily endonuclease [Nitzschia inconspicua]
MPRFSKKHQYLRGLRKILKGRILRRAIRIEDDDDDSFEDSSDLYFAAKVKKVESRRYIFRKASYRKGCDRFSADLDGGDDSSESGDDSCSDGGKAENLPWLTDEEFLQKYRMSRQSFDRVLKEIEQHPVFQSTSNGRKQAPVSHQLMVFLKYVGTEGNGASNANQRHTFSIGYGTATTYRNRVTRALCSLRDRYIQWPDAEERQQIAREIHMLYGFPHCVAIADGTLFPLATEPQTEDSPDYNGRKHAFSLSTMIVCDHRRKIRYYLAGYPGSAHDNRVFKGTELKKEPHSHFAHNQYLVGDSAFENDWFVVPAFKKLPNMSLDRDEEQFNTKLSQLRIISEHCIGMLKGRFPWLRQIRLLIKEDVRYLRKILFLIDATVVLHNMLVEFW